jgi:hypothetical protein
MPLNPTLYTLLLQEFGHVRIAHEGDAMNKRYAVNYDVDPPRLRLDPPVHQTGEYYRVNCPYCNDTKGRLWINHLWGVWDSVVHSYNLWLAVCYNDMCLSEYEARQDLYKRVYGFKNYDQRSEPLEILSGVVVDEPLKEVTYPGDWILLTDLGFNHPANQYMWSRGFEYETCEKYKLGYCVRALPEYRAAEGRIIVPIFMEETLVGWQCRYVGELDWKTSKVPKYYNLPGIKRRQILYNFDAAKEQPYGVIVEGVTNVWNVGDNAVALLGKVLTSQQLEMVIQTWKVVVILMDGDDPGKEAAQTIYDQLRRYVTCVIVTLPDGRDPANCDPEWLQLFIRARAVSEGLDLDAMTREDTSAHSTATPVLSPGGESSRTAGGGTSTETVGPAGQSVPAGPPRRPRYAAPRPQLY